MRTRRFLLAAATTALMARGDVTLLSPVCGEVFHPLTDWQMNVFAGGTREERFEILKGVDEKATRKEWRRQCPLVLKWRSTGRHTFTTWKHWSKEDDLLPSGQIGSVKLWFGDMAAE